MSSKSTPGILLVANWDSNVGYAWWLMESFWAEIATHFGDYKCHLAYPSISEIPSAISNVPITTHTLDFRKASTPQDIIRQAAFIKKNNIKAIYFSDKPSWSLLYYIYRSAGAKTLIVHDHTPGNRTPPKNIKKAFKTALHRIPGLSADAMIATTEFVRNRHVNVNCIPTDKCYVATNGIPALTSSTTNNAHLLYGIPEDRLILVMTGRANKYKGVAFVLKCLEILIHQRQKNSIHFLFLGDGPDLEYFKELAANLDINQHVTFPGRVSDVAQTLPNCSAALHPSRGEVGYSLSILEYMRAGLPVIVPDNPSVSGATTHNKTGLIYQEDSEKSFCDSVCKLIDNSDLRKAMGETAKHTQKEHFSLSLSHKQLTTALEAIL